MLGAYGTAMATRFNGFGDVQTVTVGDFPWASLYTDAARQTRPDTGGRVVPFARGLRRRRTRLMKRRG
jgi:hypothetical protein